MNLPSSPHNVFDDEASRHRESRGNPDPSDDKSALPATTSNPVYESDWEMNSAFLLAQRAVNHLRTDAVNASKLTLAELIERFIHFADTLYNRGITLLTKQERQAFAELLEQGTAAEEQDPHSHRRLVALIANEWEHLMSLVARANLFEDLSTTVQHQRGVETAPVAGDAVPPITPPTEPRAALNPLVDILEEQLLNGWANTRSINNADQLPAILREVILEAWENILFPAPQGAKARPDLAILPHFGRRFELLSFTYAPDIAVIGVPFTSLHCPWDWTFIWHEIAGIYVARTRDRTDGVISDVTQLLVNRLTDATWAEWSSLYASDLAHLIGPHRSLLGNWAEELIEDALGVLCLGDSMVTALERVLRRTYAPPRPTDDATGIEVAEQGGDERHPPMAFRIAVAQGLVQSMGLRGLRPTDGLAMEVATTIWNFHLRENLVRHPFDPSLAEACESWLAKLGRSEKGLPRGPRPYHLLIAGAAAAFRAGGAAGQWARQRTMGSYQPASGASVEAHILKVIKEVERFEALLSQQLSARDQLDVSIVGSHSHPADDDDADTQVEEAILRIDISGALSRQDHKRILRVFHTHSSTGSGNIQINKIEHSSQ